jgi:hypothetical protein
MPTSALTFFKQLAVTFVAQKRKSKINGTNGLYLCPHMCMNVSTRQFLTHLRKLDDLRRQSGDTSSDTCIQKQTFLYGRYARVTADLDRLHLNSESSILQPQCYFIS